MHCYITYLERRMFVVVLLQKHDSRFGAVDSASGDIIAPFGALNLNSLCSVYSAEDRGEEVAEWAPVWFLKNKQRKANSGNRRESSLSFCCA